MPKIWYKGSDMNPQSAATERQHLPANAAERRYRQRRRRFQAERFYVDAAGPHWKAQPALAQACQEADMTVRQAEATRCAGQRKTYGQIGEAVGLGYEAARNTVEKAWGKFRKVYRMQARQGNYHRELMECQRNRVDHRGGGPLIGILPYLETKESGRGGKRDAADYQPVSVRARVTAAADLAPDYTRCDALPLLTEAVIQFEREALTSAV